MTKRDAILAAMRHDLIRQARRRVFCAVLLAGASVRALQAQTWQGAWGHPATAINTQQAQPRVDGRPGPRPVYAPLPVLTDSTVREVVRLSAAAHSIRLRLSNEFGSQSLPVGAVHVALAGADGATLPGSDHVVTFAGRNTAEIAPGAPLLSDPIEWPLPTLTRLAVSVYYPGTVQPPAHTIFALQAWQSAGDHTADVTLPQPQPARSGNHLSEIDILPQNPGATLVAFGDSITEGVASTAGTFHGWPDRLADRLAERLAGSGWSIFNAGIGSNRLLHDTPSTNALSRFDRDALAVPGVKAVIVLLGINDIQYSHRNAAEAVRAADEIAALRQLIDRAHVAGVKIYGGTVTPFEGSPDYTPDGEVDRQAINTFARSGAFDGLVDFDAALRDPAHPARVNAAFDSGGHLHPNDAGYAAMGDAIDLALFRRR